MHRMLILACLAVTACASQGPRGFGGGPPPGGGERARLFVSPIGEPFRAPRGQGDPQDIWFAQADTDHDGRMTRAEALRDATRFFLMLDEGKDGEIDPTDIERYETILLPEVRVASGGPPGRGPSGGGPPSGGPPGGGGGRGGGGMGGGGRGGPGGGSGGGPPSEGGSGRPPRMNYAMLGAARYSFFDFPQPITPMDTNFNRGIDPREFARATDQRFALLDRNKDNVLTANELPAVSRDGFGGGPPPGRRPAGDPRGRIDPAVPGAER